MPERTFILVHLLDAYRLGHEFKRSNWPLHVTFVPWFNSSKLTDLTLGLQKAARRIKPFSAKINGEYMFGAKRNVPVNIIVASRKLQNLHERLLEVVETEYAVLESQRYIGEKFRPHVTHYAAHGRKTGQTLN